MVRPLRFIMCAVAMVATFASSALADDDPGYAAGPWHFRSVSCVDTTVRIVGPRLTSSSNNTFTQADFASGVYVGFATGLGMQPLFPTATASVTHYQGTAGNAIMKNERKGDRVQVCFLGGPAPTVTCDPDKDSRGRSYRVYDYRQHAQYWGMNEEHDCGGA